VVVLAVTLLAILVLAGCGSSEPATSASPVAASPTAASLNRADLLAFVGNALTYVREQGKDAALARFNAKDNEFNHGELYIFAYDFTGKNLAHGYDQTLVGKNLIDLTDPTGEPIIRDFIDIAEGGGGWLDYKWANPAHDGKVEDKIGYIVKAGDDWLLGAGIYGPAAETPAATASP
jgi:cytochrome c